MTADVTSQMALGSGTASSAGDPGICSFADSPLSGSLRRGPDANSSVACREGAGKRYASRPGLPVDPTRLQEKCRQPLLPALL